MRAVLPSAGLLLPISLVACMGTTTRDVGSPPSPTASGARIETMLTTEGPATDWRAAVARTAAEYRVWGALTVGARWAPLDCDAPDNWEKGPLFASRAAGSRGHARKLYLLYASDADAYLGFTDAFAGTVFDAEVPTGPDGARSPRPSEVPPGFALVKESYEPVETAPAAGPLEHSLMALLAPEQHVEETTYPFATRDGKLYRIGARRDLFVMEKVALAAGAPENTDAGWIYGTVSPEGTVTSAGRVASCMECHARAPRDRLFGIPTGR